MACGSFPSITPISVQIPGGIKIEGVPLSSAPDQLEAIRSMLGLLGAAMGPFAAVFKIVAAIQAVLKVAQSIPAALADVPPNPGKILDALEELTGKVDDLVGLIPQLAVPILIRDVIDVLLAYVDAIADQLNTLALEKARASDAMNVAASLDAGPAKDALLSVADCVNTQVDQRLAALEASGGPVNALIGVMNTIGSIIKLPAIPTLGGFSDLETASSSINGFASTLTTIRTKIPI